MRQYYKYILLSLIVALFSITLTLSVVYLIPQNEKNNTTDRNFEKSIVSIVSGIDVNKEILVDDVIVGTGFCYEKNRLITNYHNIQENEDTINVITYDDKLISATLIAKDTMNDIAILEADLNIPSLKFSDSTKCKLGEHVRSISTPISAYLRGTYSEGTITNLDIVGFGTQRLIQTNIDLSPGCSGSPIVSDDNTVLGMITFKSTEFGAEGLGFAVPSNRLKDIINRLEQGIESIDLQITFINDIWQKYGLPGAKGLIVQEVSDSSPVLHMLQAGDIIIKINGNNIKNKVEFNEAIEQSSSSKEMQITFIRDGSTQTITLEGG